MTKFSYVKPEVQLVALTEKDILAGSDVLIYGEDLFEDPTE